MYGVMIGERVVPPLGIMFIAIAAILGTTISFFVFFLLPGFNSHITVYKDKVTGVSTKRESFTLVIVLPSLAQ